MADYGAKVSAPSVSVLTGADKDMLFKPSINMLKVSAQGATTVAAGNTLTINHGLGYLPNYFCLAENSPGSGAYYYLFSDRSDFALDVRSNSTSLIITAAGFPSGTYHIYYYIFVDPM